MQMWSDRPKHPDPGLQWPFAQGQKMSAIRERDKEGGREREGERQEEGVGGWGRAVKHRAEANDNSGFNLQRRL